MAHRLLVPPVRRLEGQIRLPMIQDIGGATARRFTHSLMPRDSLRLARTSGTMIAPGPLPSVQSFVMAGPGQPNTPESMESGLRKSNASRLVDKTRGASAGI